MASTHNMRGQDDADAILTEIDGDELAIALAGNRGRAVGSRVLAKGRGAFAEQIMAVAEENDIPLHADSDLAEILSALEPEEEIPVAALAAVAEILCALRQDQEGYQGEDQQKVGPAAPDESEAE